MDPESRQITDPDPPDFPLDKQRNNSKFIFLPWLRFELVADDFHVSEFAKRLTVPTYFFFIEFLSAILNCSS